MALVLLGKIMNKKRKNVVILITALTVIIVLAVSSLLYLGLCTQLAAERMYSAVGGEGFVPGLVATGMLFLVYHGVYLPLMDWADRRLETKEEAKEEKSYTDSRLY